MRKRRWLVARRKVITFRKQLSVMREEMIAVIHLGNLSIGSRVELRLANVITFSENAMRMLTEQSQRMRGLVQDIEGIKQSVGQEISKRRRSKCNLFGNPRLVAAEIAIAPATMSATIVVPNFSTDSWGCSFGPTPAWQLLNRTVILQLVSAMRHSQYRSPIFSLPGGPQVSLRTSRIVDQSASIFHFTHIGDLDAIKSLYSQGLASSLDVSHKKWNTPLHRDVTLIDFFIATEADEDVLDLAHRSPASLAWDIILSRSKSNTVIEHLLGSFGDSRYIEDYRFSHLHEVVLDIKHSSIEEALSRDPSWINCTDTHQNTPLLWASRRGNNVHVQTLLHCGADSSIKNDVGEDALIESVYFGRLDCMLSLLRAHAPISEAADGKKNLHHACKLRDDLAYIKSIIQRGTDINRKDCLIRTPFALASSMNHFRTIKYLLDHGAEIDARDAYGSTPLMRAVRYGALEAATLLFSYGADITATDVDNLTILHKVALSTDTSMMKLLQTQDLRGLYSDTRDISGKTAYQMLVEHKPCVETLIVFTELLDIIRRGAEVGEVVEQVFEMELELEPETEHTSMESSLYESEDALESF
ncbi:hypothetical protein VE01_03138 [Pseudogymnoascus verrucosus]|uniref:Uncharacterized protein n=1 Tax=Pseudogymnoascus verrucosus TaxID=342668 RepID=A0A1B8GR14_9PEZI|nr:uncharacterized protein VE01_03138 [Pseudogymnoascus verrucosus]OBT98267.2 hypothetical protein VE01_03138 [Pseudogymnoascus verrucosus]